MREVVDGGPLEGGVVVVPDVGVVEGGDDNAVELGACEAEGVEVRGRRGRR